MKLPTEVIEKDATLEKRASHASEDLAKLRWHWTLDESNPDRVSIREYARSVGRTHKAILAMVNGYAKWSGDPGVSTLGEAIARAKVGAEQEAATDAVAEERGVTYTTAQKHHADEVKRVKQAARDAVEEGRADDFETAAKKVASTIHRSEQAEKDRKAQRANRTSLRYIELDGKIQKARRALSDGLKVARQDIAWDQEELELLLTEMDALRALTGLVDLALTGSIEVDWDAELAKLDEK